MMEDVQENFEAMLKHGVYAALKRVAELHDQLSQFRHNLDDRYDSYGKMGDSLRLHLREQDPGTIFKQMTVYGLFLQVKALALMPMLEQATWQTFETPPQPIDPRLEPYVAECIDAAVRTVSEKWLCLVSSDPTNVLPGVTAPFVRKTY
jgi:hypothetical protein